MDVLCAPSLTQARWREQFGRMLIGAFACGVPVIASDSGEIPHVVGNAGVIVPEGDVDRWFDAIGTLIGDAELRTVLAHRGRERAVAVFDWGVIARQHSAFFDEVIAGSVPARGCAA
jgi:glycosyltransferase involved in cell wall biosynthesis